MGTQVDDLAPTNLIDGVETQPTHDELPTVKKSAPSKYRHIKAFHSEPRASCLSHDAEQTPSFLGFRNLMVLVLSMLSLY